MPGLYKSEMKKLNDLEIGYLAGLIDGEGTIGLVCTKRNGENNYNPQVNITNTNLTLLDWCLATTGIGIISIHNIYLSNSKRKDCYYWRLRNNEILEFLPIILPILIIKQRQAELVLEYFAKCQCEVSSRKILSSEVFYLRRFIHEELKVLNHRGR